MEKIEKEKVIDRRCVKQFHSAISTQFNFNRSISIEGLPLTKTD